MPFLGQDKDRGSLTARLASIFVKRRPNLLTTLSSVTQKAEEPELISDTRAPTQLSLFDCSKAASSSRSSVPQPQQPSLRLNEETLKTLQKVHSSMTSTDLKESLSFLRYSLPSAAGSELPQPTVRKLNQEYPSLAEFDILRTVGTGTFARVKLVRHRPTGAHHALKSIKKVEVLRLKQLQHVLNEKCILAKVNHPFIVGLHSAYQDSDRLHMLLEYVPGGELFMHLKRQPLGRFSVEVARFYAASIILALEYLHANDIIYRDLKPENLLLDAGGYLKMTDFGFSKELGKSGGRTWTLCGTPEYLAPEVIKSEGHGKAVDWWSVGILLFEMLTGQPPFMAATPPELYRLIIAADYSMPCNLDLIAQDLIADLLQVDLSKRLGNLRGGAQDIKRHPFFAGFAWKDLITSANPNSLISCTFCRIYEDENGCFCSTGVCTEGGGPECRPPAAATKPTRRLTISRRGLRRRQSHRLVYSRPKILSAGSAEPPIKPTIHHDGDTGNYESYPESVDDPFSPMVDLQTAERIFRGF